MADHTCSECGKPTPGGPGFTHNADCPCDDDGYIDGMNPECYAMGCDDETTHEDDEGRSWTCTRCGSEGWNDYT